MEEERCDICKYYDFMSCKRHAPRVPCCSHGNEFPRVNMCDWCGDWEKKVEKDNGN